MKKVNIMMKLAQELEVKDNLFMGGQVAPIVHIAPKKIDGRVLEVEVEYALFPIGIQKRTFDVLSQVLVVQLEG